MRNKYRAKRSDGFPSKLEKAVYDMLFSWEKLGLISDLKRQQTVVLQEGPKDQRITWRVDFSFLNEKGERVFLEAKGIETQDYKIKKKLWKKNPPARLEIWKGNYKKPKLVEVIECSSS